MKQTLKFKDGKTMEFADFPIKNKNMRKIRIHRDNDQGEGIWAAFSDDGIKLYDNDSRGILLPCILVNTALNFDSVNSWGMYIPVTTQGDNRPECNLNLVDFTVPIFCKERKNDDAEKIQEKC